MTGAKWTESVAQAVESLPCKHEVQIPVPQKKCRISKTERTIKHTLQNSHHFFKIKMLEEKLI
jgi:hypothetical protein